MSLGNCDGRPDVKALVVNVALELPGRDMAPRIHGHDLLLVPPLGERSDVLGRLGIGEYWSIALDEALARNGERMVNGVAAPMSANG